VSNVENDIRPPQYARDRAGKLVLDDQGNPIWIGPTGLELRHYRALLEITRQALRIIANGTCVNVKETALAAYRDSDPFIARVVKK